MDKDKIIIVGTPCPERTEMISSRNYGKTNRLNNTQSQAIAKEFLEWLEEELNGNKWDGPFWRVFAVNRDKFKQILEKHGIKIDDTKSN